MFALKKASHHAMRNEQTIVKKIFLQMSVTFFYFLCLSNQ